MITEAPRTYAVTINGVATVTGMVTGEQGYSVSAAHATITSGSNSGGTYGGVTNCLSEYKQCLASSGKLGLLKCKKTLLECKCENGVSLCCGLKKKLW